MGVTAPANPNDPAPGLPGRNRLRLVILGFAVCFALIAGRATQLSMLAPDVQRTARGDNYRIPRPDIVDRNGVLLATDIQIASLWANPNAPHTVILMALEEALAAVRRKRVAWQRYLDGVQDISLSPTRMLTIIVGRAKLIASKDMTKIMVARMMIPPTHHL